MTLNYDSLLADLADSPLAHWQEPLTEQLAQRVGHHNNGNLPRLLTALDAMPDVVADHQALDRDTVEIGGPGELSVAQHEALLTGLQALMPWRKGPFDFFGTRVDSEWQCWMKWGRIAPYLSDLHGRTVLDVGSGNGYFGWRMLGQGAHRVIGVDPSWLSVVQHEAVNRYLRHPRHHVLPLTLEELTPDLGAFDTVFSMGVLYHRRSPLDHLEELRRTLRPGGELVLETLVVPGQKGYALVPEGRYARMNNVWFLPSVATLINWCEKMGFVDVQCIDETITSPSEQRTTAWKPGQSLADYLQPDNPSITMEGHPAPLRATLVAARPEGGRLKRYQL